jgi:hypothetical protein
MDQKELEENPVGIPKMRGFTKKALMQIGIMARRNHARNTNKVSSFG